MDKRHSWADIDLSALQHNFLQARRHADGARLCAVMKANAYGHGVQYIAPALQQVMAADDLLAVVTLHEALALRAIVPTANILMMRGPLDSDEMRRTLAEDFNWVIHSPWQADLLRDCLAQGCKPAVGRLNIWLKTNTGMNRLGMSPEQALAVAADLRKCGQPINLTLMSHLAMADDTGSSMTVAQQQCFAELAQQLSLPAEHCSLAASAGLLQWPETRYGIVRPGIMLYGASPMVGGQGDDHGLKPVMNLKSRLVTINQVRAGDTVGYGATYTAQADMPVGIVGIGYGDGYPRHAPQGTPVQLLTRHGVFTAPIIGRVSMDMLTIDLRDVPALPGDEVLLWGRSGAANISANHIADLCQTIPYELFCQVTSRVKFNYGYADGKN